MLSLSLAAVFLVITTWALIRLRKVGSREPGLPPGPPTLPILGNLHLFETKHTHLRFTEWAKIYGDIYSIKMGPTTAIVISSPKLARQYMDLRGSTTSDRPPVYVDKLISDNLEFALTPYGPIWRSMRRAAHDMLSPRACLNHIPIQRAESAQLLSDFLTKPRDFYTHINRYSGSVILGVVYGIHVPTYEDGLVQKFDRYTARLESALKPGSSPPVDIFPFLKYLPELLGPAPWKTRAKQVREEQREIFFGLLDLVLDRIAKDQRNGCFLEGVVDHQEHYGLDRELTGYLGGSLLQAGNDTTAVFLQTFLVCMIAHPTVQQRAQQEIDEVIGLDRFPEFEDFDKLPYLKAVINEIYRLRPTVPLAIPHATTIDQRMGDYLIPKGSMLFVNAWGIYRHEGHYENPDIFDPERFMKNPYGIRPGVDPAGCRSDYAFGAGRRICPGIHLANNSIALNAMNLLWAFNFEPARDPLSGAIIPVNMDDIKEEPVLLVPKPFQCKIVPRSEAKAESVRRGFEDAQAFFERFELHGPMSLKKGGV